MTQRVFNAPLQVDAPVPAYKVIEFEGPFEKTIYSFDEKSRQLVKKTVEIPVGYVVEFPRGHSIFVESLEELNAKGFGEIVPLIRMNYEAEVSREMPASVTKREIERRSAT